VKTCSITIGNFGESGGIKLGGTPRGLVLGPYVIGAHNEPYNSKDIRGNKHGFSLSISPWQSMGLGKGSIQRPGYCE